MRFTLFIDPGLRVCGCSLFEGDQLYSAWLSRNPARKDRGPAAWDAMAGAVLRDWIKRTRRQGKILHTIGAEVPQIYRQRKTNPNDLIQIAGVVGTVMATVPAPRYISYFPREWKGQVEKSVHNERVLARLAPHEKENIESVGYLQHNVTDAIGIGLFFHGRLRRR